MAHPADLELELVHLGEPDPEVSRHVAGCSRCQQFVQSLQDAKEATWRERSPEDYAPWLRQRHREQAARRPALARWMMRASGGLAVAAGVLLLATTVLRSGGTAPGSGSGGVAERGSGGMAERGSGRGTHGPRGTELVPRGSAGLSVVRVRNGETRIFRELVPVAPADTLALQFSLDRPEKLSAGILTDAGEWAAFFSDQEFPAGAHGPELTLQVNDEPGSGVLLLGPPGQIEAAKLGKPAPEVQSARISWSATP